MGWVIFYLKFLVSKPPVIIFFKSYLNIKWNLIPKLVIDHNVTKWKPLD